MVLGLGIDLIEIARFETIGDAFLNRCFSKSERESILHCGGVRRFSKTAGFFAAKEAVSKALGTGIVFPLTEIQISNDLAGKPEVQLFGKAKEIADHLGIQKISVSITHHKTTAAAVAVAEGNL